MNYSETLHYLYTKLPLFSRTGAAALKKDLHNTQALCAYLGHPEKKFKTIHVGGTNGKGSVSHMLAAVLQTAGYKTGLYTSPHLYDFRERIRINGAMISESSVVDFVASMQAQIELIEPSFFELTVAMAFDYFAQQKVDIAVIEVGLGGRLDSTNVIVPELSVITNIGMDHMAILGNTLPEIAAEKAGIIKREIPVVVGERASETDAVFKEKGAAQNAAIYFAEDYFLNAHGDPQPKNLVVSMVEKETGQPLMYATDLQGMYQVQNVVTVRMATQLLQQQQWLINETHIKKALLQVKQLTGLMGRWEILRQKPLMVLDVAHNEDGIKQVLLQLKLLHRNKQLHIVLGMVKDKDIDAVLRLLPKEAAYYFTQAHIPRALPAADLVDKAALFGLTGKAFEDVNDAVQEALAKAADDLILICGSVFLIAEVNKQRWRDET